MKMTASIFLLILTICPPLICAQNVGADRRPCWIVDVTNTTAGGDVDFVDGARVPDQLGTVNYLRQQERKTSQRPCMRAFVTASSRIEGVDEMRKIAGKIGYEEYHVYLYGERDRDSANEILWTPQVSAQTVANGSRVVDIAIIEGREINYVDGARVPGDMSLTEYLRRQERNSPRTSLVLFVTPSARIEDVENLRRIAESMSYQGFHAYVRDRRERETVAELLYGPPVNLGELRLGPQGSVPLPDESLKK